jgi:hypothetical protein
VFLELIFGTLTLVKRWTLGYAEAQGGSSKGAAEEQEEDSGGGGR